MTSNNVTPEFSSSIDRGAAPRSKSDEKSGITILVDQRSHTTRTGIAPKKCCTFWEYDRQYCQYIELQAQGLASVAVLSRIDCPSKCCINIFNLSQGYFKHNFGEATRHGGEVALKSLLKSAHSLKNGKIQALVTAPINKKNILTGTFDFIGHTEFLSNFFSSEPLMFMIGENLKIGLLTDHIPIDQVSSSITKKTLTNKILKMIKSMQNDFLIPRPKVAILGLNPHAGDNGLIGSQDEKIIKPVVEELKKDNNSIFGPFSADSFFVKGNIEKYDTVLAMFHDQGLIPFKTLNFGSGVNFTSGMPFVRTSPDHGTAYDIAGKGIASSFSFSKALLLAREVYNNRFIKTND